jgi:hypothetical protein
MKVSTKRERPVVLDNPVRSAHPDVVEPDDWRDRGTASDMVTPLWFTNKNDHGAYTRFGFGWGPIEVTRDDLSEHGTRTVGVRVAGRDVASVRTSDDGRVVQVATHDATEDQMVSVPTVGNVPDDVDVIEKLRGLVTIFKTDLTDKRRKKKYFPQSTLEAIDQLIEVVDQL